MASTVAPSSQPDTRLTCLRLIAQLDADAAGASAVDLRDRRADPRFSFISTDLPFITPDSYRPSSSSFACARDVSASGMSVLLCSSLIKKSRCSIVLRTSDGWSLTVTASVVWCRRLQGSIHHAGLRFDHRLDPSLFVNLACAAAHQAGRQSLSQFHGRVLYLSQTPGDLLNLHNLLGETSILFRCASIPDHALEILALSQTDILLADVPAHDLSEISAFLRDAARAGFHGPVALITPNHTPQLLADAAALGASAVLPKPCSDHQLIRALTALHFAASAVFTDRDILPNQPCTDFVDILPEFLAQTSLNSQRLARAIADGQTDLVRTLCLTLGGTAGNFGYKSISSLASDIVAELDASASLPAVAARACSLSRLCSSLKPRP